MQCLSTAIIQHLQLNSESLVLGVGAHSPQPPGVTLKMDGLLQRTKVPINFSGALGEFRAGCLGTGTRMVLLGTQRIPSCAHKVQMLDNVPPRQSPGGLHCQRKDMSVN